MDRDRLSHSSTPARARDAVAPAGPTAAAQTGTAPARVGAALCWLIAALACAWIAWCTAIGPLMRADAGLAAFRWTNGVAFVAMFVVCFGIVWLLVRSAHRAADSATRTTASLGGATDSTAHLSDSAHRTSAPAAHLAGRTIALPPRAARFFAAAGRLTVRATRNWRRIWLVLAIGWLWIPTTLLVAYGADILGSRGRLFGVHLNDGYGRFDDGLMVGTVTLPQTLEFLYYVKKHGFDHAVYFDTFPKRERAAAECAANVAMVRRIDETIDRLGLDRIQAAVDANDGVGVSRLVLDAFMN